MRLLLKRKKGKTKRGKILENKNRTKKKKKISIQFEGQGPTFKFIFSIQYRFYLTYI